MKRRGRSSERLDSSSLFSFFFFFFASCSAESVEDRWQHPRDNFPWLSALESEFYWMVVRPFFFFSVRLSEETMKVRRWPAAGPGNQYLSNTPSPLFLSFIDEGAAEFLASSVRDQFLPFFFFFSPSLAA